MDTHNQGTAVDFVITVFERTYRDVLQPGSIEARIAGHRFSFTTRVVLVNNVTDRSDVERLLAPMLLTGEVTEFHYVSERLDETLHRAGLRYSEIAKSLHYTDCSLVAVFLNGSPYLVYSDADVFMEKPADWIRPSLELMQADGRIAVANPNWTSSSLESETRESSGDFGIGYGFSDQLYLLRREEFARPIYRYHAPISSRYPLGQFAPTFEQRVDSYMRCRGRLRATLTTAVYVHDAEEGASYPHASFFERWKARRMRLTMKLCLLLPGNHPRYSL